MCGGRTELTAGQEKVKANSEPPAELLTSSGKDVMMISTGVKDTCPLH